MRALIDEVKRGNPLLDVSGLWVSDKSDGEPDLNNAPRAGSVGLSFMDAVHGTKRRPKKMQTSQMYFGYPDAKTGRFVRLRMVYSIPTDQLTVMRFRD